MRPMTIGEAIGAGCVGERLWLYTNYHCNLACRYCLTSSAPDVDRRSLPATTILGLADDAVRLGFRSLGITGGEPFVRRDMPALLARLARSLPVVVLTNGTLFTERFIDERLGELDGLPVALQVSLDSADTSLNDALRGSGTLERVLAGLRRLTSRGFHVRIGSTVDARSDLAPLCRLHEALGIPEEDHVVRPIITRGRAARDGLGIAAQLEDLPRELTVTNDGAFWSPASPTVTDGRLDEGELLTRVVRPLDTAAAAVVAFATGDVAPATGKVA